MAQQEKYKFVKITKKQVHRLIQELNGEEDVNFKKLYHNVVYILSDGRAILYFDTHGFLYASIEDIINYIKTLKEEVQEQPITHILKNKLLFPDAFEQHETELRDEAILKFNITNHQLSFDGVKQIDNFINSNSRIEIDSHTFSQILAYVGGVMKNNLPEGKWLISHRTDDKSIFEPYIVSNRKLYNPFFFVYRELYENLPEQKRVDLFNSMLAEIGK